MVTTEGWVERFLARIESEHVHLGDLDRLAGDGDFGDNLLGAARRARRHLESGLDPFESLCEAFSASGGTSGPLFHFWFRGFRAFTGAVRDAGVVAEAARRGLERIQAVAGAQVGDNTMVDAMAPAVEALEMGGSVQDCLERAAVRAREGADSTLGLRGRRGRSSYVGDHAVGVMDPGALAIAWFFEAAVADGAEES